MDLRETLQELSVAARSFKGGTAITSENIKEMSHHGIIFGELLQTAQEMGATPYEILSAIKGEVIGNSFAYKES